MSRYSGIPILEAAVSCGQATLSYIYLTVPQESEGMIPFSVYEWTLVWASIEYKKALKV